MGDALGDLALRHHRDDLRRLLAAAVDEIELGLNAGPAPLHVRRRRFVQEANAVDRIVELRDDRQQLRFGQVSERVLERGERTGRQLGLGRIADHVHAAVAFEKRIEPPRILVADDLQRPDALGREMSRDAQDVRLQHVLVKRIRHPLKNVAATGLRLDLERVVDMPRSVAADVDLVSDPHRRQGRSQLLLRIVPVRHICSSL